MRSGQPGAFGVFAAFGALALVACASALANRTPGASVAAPHAGAGGSPLPAEEPGAAELERSSEVGDDAGLPAPVNPGRSAGTPTSVVWMLPPDGTIGAWLVAPPPVTPDAADASEPTPSAPAWKLATVSGGVLDVAAAVDARAGAGPTTARVGGVLRVDRPGRYVLLLGADDGVAVFVDGTKVFARESPRVRRDDEDLVAFDVAAGVHALTLRLKRATSGPTRAWALHARLLDPNLTAPAAAWRLPGTGPDDVRDAAQRVARVTLDRGVRSDDYRPEVRVRFADGAPVGLRMAVHARIARAGSGAAPDPPVDVDLGVVEGPLPADGTYGFPLPAVPAASVEDGDWTVHVDAGGRSSDLPFHPRRTIREALAHARRSVEGAGRGLAAWLLQESRDSVEALCDRLAGYVAKGDGDVDAQLDDARELDELADALDRGRDPYVGRAAVPDDASAPPARPTARPSPGARARCAARTARPPTAQLSEFALYVPPRLRPAPDVPAHRRAARHERAPDARCSCGSSATTTRTATATGRTAIPRRDLDAARGHRRRPRRALQRDVPRPRRRRRDARRRLGDGDVSDRPAARHDHRAFDGRHRHCGLRAPPPRPLRRGRAPLRLPQLLRPERHRRAHPAALGDGSSPRSARTSSGPRTGMYLPLYIVHGTQGPARGEQRRPHRSLRGARTTT